MRARGFTLIELLVVIAVLGVLASLVAPMVFGHISDAKVSAAQSQIEIFGVALDAYRMDNDWYPSTTQGLNALVAAPSGEPPARRWRGPYLKKGVPLDPWGRAYRYEGPGTTHPETYEVRTLGRDGRPGGAGEDEDLTSGTAPVPAPVQSPGGPTP
jgi:general secretion pathway protein G